MFTMSPHKHVQLDMLAWVLCICKWKVDSAVMRKGHMLYEVMYAGPHDPTSATPSLQDSIPYKMVSCLLPYPGQE